MTKQDVIKKAYQDEGIKNTEKMNIDENGYISESVYQSLAVEERNFEFIDVGVFTCKLIYRPKSLAGIEDNNGWVKIESEDDLPKGYGLYEVFTKTNIYVSEPKNQYFEEYWVNDVAKNKWWMDNVSHYKKINFSSKPLY